MPPEAAVAMHRIVLGISLMLSLAATSVAASADVALGSPSVSAELVLSKAAGARGAFLPGSFRIDRTVTESDGTATDVETISGERNMDTYTTPQYSESDGYDGHTWWQENANGVVVAARAPLEHNAYAQALRGDVKEGTQARVVGIEDGCWVLELHPRADMTQRRFYDKKTFLLERVETSDMAGTRTDAYSDYHLVYGREIPYAIAHTTKYPENDWTSRVTSVAKLDHAPTFAPPPTAHVFDLGNRSELTIPTTFTRDGIVVRVTVHGRGLDFVLDSGASETVIDTKIAKQLGLPIFHNRHDTFDGSFTRGKTVAEDLALGDLHARHFVMGTLPYEHHVEGHEVVGLLGGDFFASGLVSIDFRNYTVRMLRTADVSGWTKVPIDVSDFVPMLSATINGAQGTFIADLGAAETTLYPHYFAQLMPDHKSEVNGRIVGVGGKAVAYRTYRFDEIDVGDLSFANMLATVMDTDDFESANYDGLLGRPFLQNFDLIFDYGAQTLYMRPNGTPFRGS